MANETRLQRETRQALTDEFGGFCRKIWVGEFQAAGMLDIIFVCCGLFFNFETKDPTGNHPVSDLQKLEIKQVIEDGEGVAAVIEYKEQACKIVRDTLRARGLLQHAHARAKARSRLVDPKTKTKRRRWFVLETRNGKNTHRVRRT